MYKLLLISLIPLIFSPWAQQDGNVLLHDDFSTRAFRWVLSQDAKHLIDYADEQFIISINSPGEGVFSVPDIDLALRRYRLSTTATLESNDPNSSAGVILNYQDEEHYYIFEVSAAGDYWFTLVRNGKRVTPLLAEGQLPPSDELALVVTMIEGQFNFEVNGLSLPSVQDKTHEYGIIGLYGRAGRGYAIIRFDDVRLVDVINP